MKALWIAAVAIVANAWADGLAPRHVTPFTGIGKSALGSVTGTNGLLQLGAIGATAGMVYSGTDTRIHNFYVRNDEFDPFTIPAVWGGYLLPVTVGTGLYAAGWFVEAPEAYKAGCIVLQSTMLSFGWQSALKLGTGRKHPGQEVYGSDHASREFRFGFNRGGIDWGWPSGVAMMGTSSLVALNEAFPDRTWLRWGSGAWIAYALASTPAHEKGELAWASDAVAGALIGVAIGRSVGATYSDTKDQRESVLRFSPIVGSANGILAEVVF